jgi:hypothetical protein
VLAAWEKSLAINPNQPDIKKKVESLRPKKQPKTTNFPASFGAGDQLEPLFRRSE